MMDKVRYAKVRDLFLEAEDLPRDEQAAFVDGKCDGDRELADEVMSLLAEHDAGSAQREGERQVDVQAVLSQQSSDEGDAPGSDLSLQRSAPSDAAKDQNRSLIPDVSATMINAQRTHASPRSSIEGEVASTWKATTPKPDTILWAEQSRKARRINSGWLLAAAIFPTMLVGWLTYRTVRSLVDDNLRSVVSGIADGLQLTTRRYLDGDVALVESWAREGRVRGAILHLEGLARVDDPKPALKAAPEADVIMRELKLMSGKEDIKFVVWDRRGIVLASWLPDRADVGNSIVEDQANGLARVFRGQSIVFGPARLIKNTEGFQPETDLTVMAPIVPVFSESGQVVAALLVRGIGMFKSFDGVFRESALSTDVDVYCVDSDGVMVTDAPAAIGRANENRLDVDDKNVAGVLRVTDPGEEITDENRETIERSFLPLTHAATRVVRGKNGEQLEPYRNYAGEEVVGAWRWMERWKLGIVVEKAADEAFAPTRAVRLGFLALGGLLAMTALTAAAGIARRSARRQAMLHPLSRYEVLGELGSGGMGVVYKAKHRQLGRDAALKILRADRRQKEDRLRFDREARLAASLASPHCVKVYDYGNSPNGESFCVMEYLNGLTLYEVVARSGHQSVGRSLFVLRQICDAMGEAHANGLLHRDLKPQNVMLSHDAAAGDWAVVFDFGLAKPVEANADMFSTSEKIWSGTPMYMAPERFREPQLVDPRSDIYAIGCIAYFLISGHPPFAECDPESMFALILNDNPIRMSTHRGEHVPEEIVAFVRKCMAKKLENRFQTIREVADAIDQLRVFHSWTSENADMWWQIHGQGRAND